MRSIIAVLLVMGVTAAARAEMPPSQVNVRATIDRGLAFLAKDAVAWKKEHNCISCHHASLIVWSMYEAKQHGHAVDEAVLAEMTTWSANTVGPGKVGVPRPASAPRALNTKAPFFAMAFNVIDQPSEEVKKAMPALVQTIVADQVEDGSWQSWPETRPPLFGHSDEIASIFEVLSILPAAKAGDHAAVATRDKGVKWLAEHPTGGDPQAIAMRLVLWKQLDRPFEEWHPLARKILERQNADGGWSQTYEMGSDAWATGQALYALAYAGIKGDDPAVQSAQQFLIKTQREDGSWPMTSRPTKPGGAGSSSLIPITGAGSAWAVLGLVHSR